MNVSAVPRVQSLLKPNQDKGQLKIQELSQQLKKKEDETEKLRDKSNAYITILREMLAACGKKVTKEEIDKELPQEITRQTQARLASQTQATQQQPVPDTGASYQSAQQLEIQQLTQQLKNKGDKTETLKDKSNAYITILLKRLKACGKTVTKEDIDKELPQMIERLAQEKRSKTQAAQQQHLQPVASGSYQSTPPPLQSAVGYPPAAQGYPAVYGLPTDGPAYSTPPLLASAFYYSSGVTGPQVSVSMSYPTPPHQ